MALTVTGVEQLRDYLCGVMARAEHHADNVHEIAMAVAGGILWRKDEGEPIQVLSRDGEAKNVLWANMGGQRYAFSYNHDTKQIDMRRGNVRGQALYSFSNATALASVYQIFHAL